MSTPTKMSEKNTSPERRSVWVMAKSSKRSSTDESPKNPVFHNIVMRLTDHSGMGDALCFELCEDLDRFFINEFYLITGLKCVGSTHLPMDVFEEKTVKKNDKVHYSILGFPHALLVWSYETLPSIVSKFTTKYDQAIPRMMSWTTADNVMFDDVFAAFTTVGESQLKCFALMPTEEELKNPWVARLYLKKPKAVPQLPPPMSSVPRSSTDTKSEWRDFQKEI
ncbi:hypothetical protein TIFTF001_008909 [Ficus carica]|uniref:Uncharacterized protein n=1 Tax=Ficus carica TaxID=3494 RepID=A0AA87ZM71_FICCA|nr:hypothetical protein TIFTF001_008909 [Ficus carica]